MNKILLRDYPIGAASGGQAPRRASSYRKWATALWAALVTLSLGQAAQAAPGDLDPSFDADGRVLTHFGAIDGDAPAGSDEPTSVAIQPDGKLVVAGNSSPIGGFFFFGSTSDAALARYNPDGSLDTSFGSGGRVLTDFGGQEFVSTLGVQSDGKLLVVVNSFNEQAFETDRFLARYNLDGSLDASFGSGGRVPIDIPADLFVVFFFLQPDGRLVVVGTTNSEITGRASEFALLRYNPDGRLDASFGSGGRVLTDFPEDPEFPGIPTDDFPSRLVVQPDGKLLVSGTSSVFVEEEDFSKSRLALARYNPDGSLDASFGSAGLVLTDFNGRFANFFPASEFVIRPDGKLVGLFQAFGADFRSTSFFLARFNADGSLDGSFGAGGVVVDVASA